MNAFLKYRLLFLFTSHIFFVVALHAQNNYRYTVDLNNVQDDQLTVELVCPKISTQQTMFYLPKIVPGTYMNSNYGKYVHDLKAFDKAGKELPVKKIAAVGGSWASVGRKNHKKDRCLLNIYQWVQNNKNSCSYFFGVTNHFNDGMIENSLKKTYLKPQ